MGSLNPRQFMYHHSPYENRSSIKKTGLHTSSPYDPSYHQSEDEAPEGVYLSPDQDFHRTEYGHDVWRVKTEGLHLRDDPDDPNGEYGFKYSPSHIDPSRVRLAKGVRKERK